MSGSQLRAVCGHVCDAKDQLHACGSWPNQSAASPQTRPPRHHCPIECGLIVGLIRWQSRPPELLHGSSYLYKIARDLIVDELPQGPGTAAVAPGAATRGKRQVAHPSPTRREQGGVDALQRALNALPERRREAFMLVHIQNLTVRQAAEVMGNAPQTLANQVSAALAELRRVMKPYVER